MSAQNVVWVVISCDQVAEHIKSMLDRGFFPDAQRLSDSLKEFMAKVTKEAQAKGGHVYVSLYERAVMEIPITFAEELPNIIEGFKAIVGSHIAVGLGMTFDEAAISAQKSIYTGEIELYDPETAQANPDTFNKADDENFELPPNIFAAVTPSPAASPEKPIPREPPFAARPPVDKEIQLETQYVQAIAQTMGAPSPQEMQQQVQAQQAAQGQIEGLPPELQAALQAQQEGKDGEKKEKSKDSKDSEKSSESKKKKKSKDKDDDEDEEGDEEDSKTNDKLAGLLLTAKEQIPQLMSLQESNPDAFQQAMKLIHKLVDLTRSRKKVSKNEVLGEIEELNKSFNTAIMRGFPIGTRKGQKQKVVINGKAVWRSMAAGRVLDSQGQPVSVKSHNAAATSGKVSEQ